MRVAFLPSCCVRAVRPGWRRGWLRGGAGWLLLSIASEASAARLPFVCLPGRARTGRGLSVLCVLVCFRIVGVPRALY